MSAFFTFSKTSLLANSRTFQPQRAIFYTRFSSASLLKSAENKDVYNLGKSANVDDSLLLLNSKNSMSPQRNDAGKQSVAPPTIKPTQNPDRFADELLSANDKASSRLYARRFAAAIQEEDEAPETIKQVANESTSFIKKQIQQERRIEIEQTQRHLTAIRIAKEELTKVVRTFDAPVRFAFAYGSGVFSQTNYTNQKPMVDLIFAVSHPQHWHSINIQQNPSHYSLLGRLGSGTVSLVQQKLGAGVYFNPYVEINGQLVKYGVVSVDTLTSDLLEWNSLYLAGRMHKPILPLNNDKFVRLCAQVNLANALRVALLMLPKNFTEVELFKKIVSISYTGDLRFRLGGENPRKVDNIVEGQINVLRDLYSSSIEGMPNLQYIGANFLQQDMDIITRANIFNKLPEKLYNRIKHYFKSNLKVAPEHNATEQYVINANLPDITHLAVQSIVRWPSASQSIKGLLTAGLSNSVRYISEKKSKARL